MIKNNLIFFKKNNVKYNDAFDLKEDLTIRIFKPTLLKLKPHKNKIFIYLFWYLFTFGKYKIIYVTNRDEKIVCYSHLLPKFFKFPFMAKQDLHMGPSWTDPNYRGQGIFTYVKNHTLQTFHNKGVAFWAIVEKDNYPSIRVQLKNGFEIVGTGAKSKLLGRYEITCLLPAPARQNHVETRDMRCH